MTGIADAYVDNVNSNITTHGWVKKTLLKIPDVTLLIAVVFFLLLPRRRRRRLQLKKPTARKEWVTRKH